MNYRTITACMLASCMAMAMQGASTFQSLRARFFGSPAVPTTVSTTSQVMHLVGFNPNLPKPLNELVLDYCSPEVQWHRGAHVGLQTPPSFTVYSPDWSQVATVEKDPRRDNRHYIIVTNVATQQCIKRIPYTNGSVISWSCNGRLLACNIDVPYGVIFHIYDPFSEVPLPSLKRPPYTSRSAAIWSPRDGDLYAFLGSDKEHRTDLVIWDNKTEDFTRIKIQEKDHLTDLPAKVLWHPTNKSIIAVLTRMRGRASELSVCDIPFRTKLYTLNIQPSDSHTAYNDAAFSSDGVLLALAHDKGCAIYDAKTGSLQRTISDKSGIHYVIWLGEKTMCAVTPTKKAYIIEAESGAILSTIENIGTDKDIVAPYFCERTNQLIVPLKPVNTHSSNDGIMVWKPCSQRSAQTPEVSWMSGNDTGKESSSSSSQDSVTNSRLIIGPAMSSSSSSTPPVAPPSLPARTPAVPPQTSFITLPRALVVVASIAFLYRYRHSLLNVCKRVAVRA